MEEQPFPVGRPAWVVQIPLPTELYHCSCAAVSPGRREIDAAGSVGRGERHRSAVWCPCGAKIVVPLEGQLDTWASVEPLDPNIDGPSGVRMGNSRDGELLPIRREGRKAQITASPIRVNRLCFAVARDPYELLLTLSRTRCIDERACGRNREVRRAKEAQPHPCAEWCRLARDFHGVLIKGHDHQGLVCRYIEDVTGGGISRVYCVVHDHVVFP